MTALAPLPVSMASSIRKFTCCGMAMVSCHCNAMTYNVLCPRPCNLLRTQTRLKCWFVCILSKDMFLWPLLASNERYYLLELVSVIKWFSQKLECSIFLLKYLNIIISAISPFSNVGSHIYHLNKNTKSNHCKKRDTKQNSNKINKHPVLWTGWRYDSYSSGGDTPPISRWTADHLMIPQANAAHVPKHACPQKSSAPSIPGGTTVVWPAAAMTLHASRC